MSWIDLVILGIFFFSVLIGLIRGFIGELISLVTLLVSFVFASLFANQLATAIMTSSLIQYLFSVSEDAAQPIHYFVIGLSFILIFVAISLVGSVIRYLFSSLLQNGILDVGNRILGAVFGLVRGYFINLILIFLIQLTSFTEQTAWRTSALVPFFQSSIIWLNTVVSPKLEGLTKKFAVNLDNKHELSVAKNHSNLD